MQSEQATSPSTKQSNKPLSYSYWLGTFVLSRSVAPRILIDVLLFGLLSTMTIVVVRYVSREWGISLAIPARPFEVAGAVLGLLLVLRLNAGYDRWWEARKLWGGIVNQSRNLAMAALAYGPDDPRWQSQFVRWTAAFPHVVRRSLRGEEHFPELASLLDEPFVARLSKSDHMPNFISTKIAMMLAEGLRMGMDGFGFSQAEEQRARLIDHLGSCERILKTPFARSGAIQVRQFIFIFLATLPFALLSDFESGLPSTLWVGESSDQRIWLVPFFVMLLAYMLLALDRIGMELQNPFDTRRVDFLPLDDICTTIERNLMELLFNDERHDFDVPHMEDVELPPDASTHPETRVDIS
jgi:ion channel-forming bestrophin family protein